MKNDGAENSQLLENFLPTDDRTPTDKPIQATSVSFIFAWAEGRE